MPHLSRTEFVLQTSKQHFESLSSTDPNKALLGVFLTFLVCVSFYSEIEVKLLEMVTNRLTVSGDQRVATFVGNIHKGTLSRVNKTDISDCAALFGQDVRDAFNNAVSQQDVTFYGNLITQRHSVAHSPQGQLLNWTTATLSLADVEQGLSAAERLLTAFETSIAT